MQKKDILMQNMKTSLACAGIDPDLSKIPADMRKGTPEETIYHFLTEYVDIVAPHICAFKAQKAFFDIHSGGHDLLKEVISYVHKKHPKLPVLLDCKIGDIDNTMGAYTTNVFDKLGADGVLINPYMGDDVLEAFKDYPDKMVVILAKTSNQGGSIVQDQILSNGQPLWMHVLDMAMNRWNGNGNIIPVISAVENVDLLKQARAMIPDNTPILFAGVGAQGRDMSDVKYLLNSQNSGVFVNSSRGLMYPNQKDGVSWEMSVKRAVMGLQHELNALKTETKSKFLILGGVSAVGKTTIMKELQDIDSRFTYISPDTTRPLRDGEKDKNHVSEGEMKRKADNGEYLVINEINGIYYATPKAPIKSAMEQGNFPLLDFPIDNTGIIEDFCGKGKTFTAYLEPPSINVLRHRLQVDNRDPEGKRFAKAQKELILYKQGEYDSKIDIKLVSENGKAREIAQRIHKAFLNSLDGQNDNRTRGIDFERGSR